MEIQLLLRQYNPWLEQGEAGLQAIPTFTRPVFDEMIRDIDGLPQILSITGPRRIGKSTLLRQLIRHYLKQGYPAELLVYYSLDDPALLRPSLDRNQFMEELLEYLLKKRQQHSEQRPIFLFLDEIQRLENWELYLKKFYDLKYPVRWVISGSASSPIFKKSRESLLGRVKEISLLPFSFREFMLYRHREQPGLIQAMNHLYEAGKEFRGILARDPQHLALQDINVPRLSPSFFSLASEAFEIYLREGGFPEVWEMPAWEQKVDYLYDNQIKKVIYEDLVLVAEFRKPEQLKHFYLSLLEQPGREVNFRKLAQETGISTAQIDKYLPLLEMTDMVARVPKFRKSALRVRQGNVKFYLVDLALRNAVLRLDDTLLADPAIRGLYAENLVYNALRKWKGAVQIDYFREQNEEVDFVIHLRPGHYLPIEVKFRDSISEKDTKSIRNFTKRFSNNRQGIIVTKRPDAFSLQDDNIFMIPLIYFLLMFD